MFAFKNKILTLVGLLLVISGCKISPPISVDYDTNYRSEERRVGKELSSPV